jgi:hypothetical protein
VAQVTVETMSPADLDARWRAWVERIYNETVSLGWNRRIFRLLQDVARRNPRLQATGGHVLDWMFENYIVSAAMTFRRELDKLGDAENLRNLLHEMKKRPDVISRARHRAAWGAPAGAFYGPDNAFDQLQFVRQASPENDHLDPAMVDADLEALVCATERVRVLIERSYAHRMPVAGQNAPLTFKDFDAALDAVAGIFKKYYAIITLSALVSTEPTPQYNATECFTFPWMQPERQ